MGRMTGSVYNRSGGPLVIDEVGHQIDAGEHMHGLDVESEIVAEHIAAERLIVTKRKRGRRAPEVPKPEVEVPVEPVPDPPSEDDTPDPDAGDTVAPSEES